MPALTERTTETDSALERAGFELQVPKPKAVYHFAYESVRRAVWAASKPLPLATMGPGVRIPLAPAWSLSQQCTTGLSAKSPALWRRSASGWGR